MAAQLLRARATPQGLSIGCLSTAKVCLTTRAIEFCLALKAERERKGITLAEIANSTKIPAYMFAALERNDLRRWPKGLFRRSFFRDYARMIGMEPAEACAEFVRLFPDDTGTVLTKPAGAADDADQESSFGWRSIRRGTDHKRPSCHGCLPC